MRTFETTLSTLGQLIGMTPDALFKAHARGAMVFARTKSRGVRVTGWQFAVLVLQAWATRRGLTAASVAELGATLHEYRRAWETAPPADRRHLLVLCDWEGRSFHVGMAPMPTRLKRLSEAFPDVFVVDVTRLEEAVEKLLARADRQGRTLKREEVPNPERFAA